MDGFAIATSAERVCLPADVYSEGVGEICASGNGFEVYPELETLAGERGYFIPDCWPRAGAISRESRPGRALLVDCLTLWLSNHYFAANDFETESRRLAGVIAELRHPVVFVSNEIGLGIVPDGEIPRDFRDAQGRLNQTIAAACERVIFVTAGLPLVMKPNNQGKITL